MSVPTAPGSRSTMLGADHEACARERIHVPGTVQPHGVLLTLDPQCGFAVIAASRNVADLQLGPASPDDLFGRSPEGILGAAFMETLQQRFAAGRLRGETPWLSILKPGEPAIELDVLVHAHDGLIHVELDPTRVRSAADILESASQLQEAILDLRNEGNDLGRVALAAARAVRLLTGYERVLIYRFDGDWNGQAIAEDKTPDWKQSLDGLHFPASDIPIQARELYRRSTMRWVPDRDAVAVPLEVDQAWKAARPLQREIDLSHVGLRSFSPAHLEYHRNMGVNGSMSVSIILEDRLWGLVVCHHRQPYQSSPGQRVVVATLTNALAVQVGLAERAASEAARQADMEKLPTILTHMEQAEGVMTALTAGAITIKDLFASTGAAVLYGDELRVLGQVPPAAEIRKLTEWLQARGLPNKVFDLTGLGSAYPAWSKHAALASGLLAAPLSPDWADMLLWFRPEEPQLVDWGGIPYKEAADDTLIAPRKSFERWVETRRGFARTWTHGDQEIAEVLRSSVAEVIIRSLRQSQQIEAVNKSRAAAEEALFRSNEALAKVRAEQAREEGAARFLFATQAGRLGVWELDLVTGELSASAICKKVFGRDPEAAFSYAELLEAVHPNDRSRIDTAIKASAASGEIFDAECRLMRTGKPVNWVHMQAQVLLSPDGPPFRLAGISLDVTERVRIDERMRQSQRIEAVGRLTAGVAHDFNNVLQALLGSIELAREEVVDRPEAVESLDLALQAGRRGARLTSHLLSFSRQQVLLPKALNLSQLLKDMSGTLARTLGHSIAIHVEAAPNLPDVFADAAQLDSALLNLALNARDAMPEGGELRISAHATAGHVVIVVADTGEGMAPEVLAHACEPFFSTKGVKGSGLGLSMVQGFASQSGGDLKIQSLPSHGTRVVLNLPIANFPALVAPPIKPTTVQGKGRILVVDDDVDAARVTKAILVRAGFEVNVVGSGNEALAELFVGLGYDAVITDFAMAGMDGVDVVLQAREIDPALPALVITGYAGAMGLESLPEDVAILRKPFQRHELVAKTMNLVERSVVGGNL